MKKLLPWLLLAIVLRLVIIPITLHPDIRGYNFGAYLISQEGRIFDFYDYLSNLPEDHPLVKLYGIDLFIYPPLVYLLMAAFMKIFSPLYPWELFQQLIYNMSQVFGDPKLPLLLFFLKAPFLVIDLICLWLIGNLFNRPTHAFLARILWLFNPVTIYASYMIGQFDILIAFFIILALAFCAKQKYAWGAVALGLGGAVKLFPLLLLPFLAFVGAKTWLGRLKLLAIGVASYIIVVLPYLPSTGFRRYALLASQTDKLFFAKIPVSGAEFLPIFLVIFVFLIWWCWRNPRRFELWQWILLVLLTFFSVTHYHPQWFVWVAPLLVIFLAWNLTKAIFPTAVLLASYIIIVFLFEPSLNFGLFSILNPALSEVSLTAFISRFYDPNIFASVVRGVFAATSLFIAYELAKNHS